MPAFYRDAEKAEQEIAFLKTGGLICSHLAAGRAFCKGIDCTAIAEVALLNRQKCPKATWGKPQDPDAPERPPGRANDLPERRLNGAYKVSATHFYRPRAGAQKGEPPPPLSPPQRRGTMGQVKQILYSLQNRFLGKSQSLPPCGARKNLRAARLLDFFDRCGCSASLHPPLAALGSAPPTPPPWRGRGRLGK